jgi:hypothetical protein
MSTAAWALVGFGILIAAIGAVPIIAWEARPNATIQRDILEGRQRVPWAWPTLVLGVSMSVVGGVLVAIGGRENSD